MELQTRCFELFSSPLTSVNIKTCTSSPFLQTRFRITDPVEPGSYLEAKRRSYERRTRISPPSKFCNRGHERFLLRRSRCRIHLLKSHRYRRGGPKISLLATYLVMPSFFFNSVEVNQSQCFLVFFILLRKKKILPPKCECRTKEEKKQIIAKT